MLRTALRPRWLALLVVVLLAATGMAALGNWQLHRARERTADAVREKQARAPRPLAGLLAARQTFPGDLSDAPVTARGHWDDTRRVLVTHRTEGGADGFWVVTPLVLEDGSAVPVVRGWVAGEAPARADAVHLPSGTSSPPGEPVDVRGILRPAEPPAARNPGQDDGTTTGRLTALDVTTLVKMWPYPLLTGYLIASEPAAGLTSVDTVDDEAGGLALQNLSYALQWWLFAALGLFFWWRLVRDDARGTLRADPDPRAPSSVGDDVPVQGGRHPGHPAERRS